MTNQREKITIQQIADYADVSISTVSRVLSGNAKVAADKHEAVLAAVKALNYRPNMFARGLASGQSMTVGVITQHISSPFYDAITKGILEVFEDSPYSPLIVDGQWKLEIEKRALHTLQNRQVDGIIVVGGNLELETLKAFDQHTPVVVVAREIEDFKERCIYTDNFQAAYNATQFLIRAGHKEIAHISGLLEHPDANLRLQGYKQALIDANIPYREDLIVHGNFLPQSGLLAVEALFTRNQTFSAIFCANDQMAMGTQLALYRRGIRVPADVSLIGFDDQPASAFMTPPLTTMRPPAEEMGRSAAAHIFSILKKMPYEAQDHTCELIVRESVSRVR